MNEISILCGLRPVRFGTDSRYLNPGRAEDPKKKTTGCAVFWAYVYRHSCYLLLWQNKREKSSNFCSYDTNATDRENTGTVTHVAPPQRVRMPHQTLSVKSTQICVQVFTFFTVTLSSKGVYLTTAPVFTPSVVNGVSDKERKWIACDINLAGPLVPEDRENKLFRNYYPAIRRRIRRTQIFITLAWPRQILHCFVEANTECWIHWISLALSERIHHLVTHHVPSNIIKCKRISELQITKNIQLFSENLFPA